jgi:hypothetical protein
MSLGGPAVPEQPERRCQRQPLPASVPATARLQRQTLGPGFAPALVLAVMGQLSERFVMQHCLPSFPRGFGRVRRRSDQRELRS